MASKAPHSPREEQQLMAFLWSPEVKDDPLAFVMAAFPWGKTGTPLENFKGPRSWQKQALLEMKDHIAHNRKRMLNGQHPEVLRTATSSGRGIGKSSLVAFKTLWMMSTNLGSTTIIAANSEAQLKTKTWAEIGKWHTLAINSHWFDRNTVSLFPSAWFGEALRRDMKIDTTYYQANGVLWTEENPDAFAGTHNMAGIQVIFDEASGIVKPIWDVTEGFFTEPILHRYWDAYSNPRRNTGAFFECFHKNRNFWRTKNIDSRLVEGTDPAIYDRIVAQYGEDSDEARVEVRGLFPAQGQSQFIGADTVYGARDRQVFTDRFDPLVMAVDVARFGDDKSVIYLRCNRDARTLPPFKFKGLDTVQLAAKVAELATKYQPDAICVDGAGVGGGVVDQLRHMKYRVHDVQLGGKADEDQRFQNKRVELWHRMKEWLPVGAIPNDSELIDDILGPEYEFDNAGRVKLESKEKMKDRGLASPDVADALALTFAVNPPRKDLRVSTGRRTAMATGMDHKVLG
jgi:hypothetical protein